MSSKTTRSSESTSPKPPASTNSSTSMGATFNLSEYMAPSSGQTSSCGGCSTTSGCGGCGTSFDFPEPPPKFSLTSLSKDEKLEMIAGDRAPSNKVRVATERERRLLQNHLPPITDGKVLGEPGGEAYPDLGDLTEWTPPTPGMTPQELRQLGRREFLRQLALGSAVAGVGLLAGSGCKPDTLAAYTQSHYLKMSPSARKLALARLERQYLQRFKKRVKVKATPPLPKVRLGSALDLDACIGCRKCAEACAEENNTSRDPQIQWIRVMQLESPGAFDLNGATAYYNPPLVPEPGKRYFPTSCQQCDNPPCVHACPVGATWKDPNGVIVIDYDWCIGCRYCLAACPYMARYYNWGKPTIPTSQLNTDTHYLGNRPRPVGVVEKCTFCIQRSRKGRYPACVEACPVGARKFGDLNDPNGELQYILRRKNVMVWKAELNTKPKFFFY